MDYQGEIYRPPSEAESLLLQVTVGCSHNKCDFCSMYREKVFQIKPMKQIFADIDESVIYSSKIFKVFLCDGDAMILPFAKLKEILEYIKEKLPNVRRVSSYADSVSILHKTDAELLQLKELGLGLLYEGIESGNHDILSDMHKRAKTSEMIAAAAKLKTAGIKHSVMFLLGLGGVEKSEQHAIDSAKLLTKLDPAYAAALTLTIIPGTPLAYQAQDNKFILPDRFGMLKELRILIANSTLTSCLFSANHASNYLPIQGFFPKDKEKLLKIIDIVIDTRDESILKPEYMRGL